MSSLSARDRWKRTYSHLRSIANDQKDGKVQAVVMGHTVTVRSAWGRPTFRLATLETDAARRARYINEAARLTSPTDNGRWDDRMYRWHKARASAHINLARESAAPALPAPIRGAA